MKNKMSIINNEQDTKEYLQNNTYTKVDIDDKIENYNIQETKDAIKWFEMNDIVAWADNDETSVYIGVNSDTHVLISGSEVSYRAELYREKYEN